MQIKCVLYSQSIINGITPALSSIFECHLHRKSVTLAKIHWRIQMLYINHKKKYMVHIGTGSLPISQRTLNPI